MVFGRRLDRRCVSDPLPPAAAVPLTKGDTNASKITNIILPLLRGRAAEGGRGSLTHRWKFQNAEPLLGAKESFRRGWNR
jgi:hypothetical protein